jgi:hypothetical protein
MMDDSAIRDGTGTAKRDAPLEDGIVFVVVLLGEELEKPPTPIQGFVKFVFGWIWGLVCGICSEGAGWFAENHFDSVLAELGTVLLEFIDHPAEGFISGSGFVLWIAAANVGVGSGKPDLGYILLDTLLA